MPHAFVSYVRENRSDVDRLCADLNAHSIETWTDRTHLHAGQRWKAAIRSEIRDGSAFLACFSKEFEAKARSYMNEEITFAIGELRQPPTDRAWFIPVLLSPYAIPDRDIGGGETLRDIHWVQLYEDWDHGIEEIAHSIASGIATYGHTSTSTGATSWRSPFEA